MEEVAGLIGESTSSSTGLCNWETKEDDEGSVVVDIAKMSTSTDAATLGGRLRAAASYWRSQGKKALRLKVPLVADWSKIVLAAIEAGFTVHPPNSTHIMLALTFREKEHYSVPTNAVDQLQGDQHFGSYDVLKMFAEQSRSSPRHSSLIPQWQTQGYRNFEAAADVAAPLEALASLSPQQLLNSPPSLLPQWQANGHRNSQAAETGGTGAENKFGSVHLLELSANQAPSVMFYVGSASELAALSAERPSPSAQKQPVSDWPTQEDGEGNVVADIVNLPVLADAANVFNLRDAASYWRSQMNAEQDSSSLRHPSMLPQWQTQGYRNFEAAAERGGANAKINASGQPLELVSNLPTTAMTDLDFNSDVAATPEALASLSPQQLLNSPPSLLPQWQPHGQRNSQAAETGGTGAENNPRVSVHLLELAVNPAPSGMIDVGSKSEADAAVRRCMERSHHQPGSDNYEERVRTTKRRPHSSQHNSAQTTKRSRGPNWTPHQKLYLLKHMHDYKSRQKHVEGEPRDWFRTASRSYFDEYGIMIEPEKWQRQMDSLMKQFKAIRTHEWEIQSGKRNSASYWELSEDAREAAHKSLKNLPLSFDQAMFQLMENIHQIQEKNTQRGSRGRQVQVQQSSSDLLRDSTIFESAGPSNGNRPSHHVLPSSDIGSLEGIEGETVGPDVGIMLPRSTASTIDVEDKIARMESAVTRAIADAIQAVLSAMQKNEEGKKKHRQVMLANQAEQLANQAEQLAATRELMELTRSNNVNANTYGVPIGGVDSNVDPTSEHGEDALRSYFADEEPDEGFANFD